MARQRRLTDEQAARIAAGDRDHPPRAVDDPARARADAWQKAPPQLRAALEDLTDVDPDRADPPGSPPRFHA